MALVLADRVQETTTTTGTGAYTLAGAKAGFASFASVGNNNTTYYAVSDGTDYEIGLATYSSNGPGYLNRTTVITSSNSNNAVNWGAGEKDVFLTLPGEKAVIEDGSNNVAIGNNISVGGTVDGRDLAVDGLKLDNIEPSATADQTDAEIKTAYENNADTNAFTDALLTKLNGVAASANLYVHPDHTGEVTSTADGATVVVDNVIDEGNLKVSNTPTNGYFLSAQSANVGGLTWAQPSFYADADVDTHLNRASANSGEFLSWNGSDYDWAAVSAGYADSDVDTHLNVSGAQTNEVLSWNGSDYNWTSVGANQALDTTSSPTFSTLTVTNTVTADTFNATSDATLKTNIAPIENPLAILEKITGVSFDWKTHQGSAEGVLAQDVEQVLPNAVNTDEQGKKSVSYNNLVGVLIEAVKGQQKQINKLKDKLNGLST
tara:strand:+ start:1052 stop:2350 length:1299 start_codon:yes stop_codon:yes gene_type:complete